MFPTPGDLPDSRVKPTSLKAPALADGFLTTKPPGKPNGCIVLLLYATICILIDRHLYCFWILCFIFFAMPHCMQDLSSLMRESNCAPCSRSMEC